MRPIINDKKYEVSLLSMNNKSRTCRVKVHFKGDDFANIREYSLDNDFDYYQHYATEHDWKTFFASSGCLSDKFVKSTKMY